MKNLAHKLSCLTLLLIIFIGWGYSEGILAADINKDVAVPTVSQPPETDIIGPLEEVTISSDIQKEALSHIVEVPTETIRVGDVLYLTLPGEEDFNQTFQIDRKGKIELPEIGKLHINGMSLSQADTHIREKLSVVFRDIAEFSISLKERSLPVTVLGYVNNPGSILLSAEGNVQMAISKAEGLKPGAQLDRVQLRRGKDIIEFDYKSYLDSGDINILPSLHPLDVIFIPVSPLLGNVQIDFDARTLAARGDASEDHSSVKVFGEVINPGSFSYKTGATALDMIMRAGGVTRYAGVEQIRIIHGGKPIPFDLKLYLDTADASNMPSIAAGDVIFIPQKIEGTDSGQRSVYVMGEVNNPGALEMQKTTNFINILASAGGPTRFADTRLFRILKVDGEIINFDLYAFTENPKGIVVPDIQVGDAIYVPQKRHAFKDSWVNTSPDRAVQIMGAVSRPGRYAWSDEMSLLDLLGHAGGPTARADTSIIQILLPHKNQQKKPTIFNLEVFIKNGGALEELPHVVGGAIVMVPELPRDPTGNKSQWVRQAPEASIYVFGQVGNPGRYAFNDTLSFLDIISAAEGPNADADLRNIRVTHRNGTKTHVTKVNLAQYFENGDENSIPHVKPGDVIYVPEKNPNWLDVPKEQTIRVLGSVNKPGRYRFEPGMTILDLLAEAGGPTLKAYQKKIVVVNFNNKEKEAQVFNLVKFAKTGDFSLLPTLELGDTVYVPDISQSNWKKFIAGVKDITSIITLPVMLNNF